MKISEKENLLLSDIVFRKRGWFITRKLRVLIGKLLNERVNELARERILLEDIEFLRNQRDDAWNKISNLLESLQTIKLELTTTRENFNKK